MGAQSGKLMMMQSRARIVEIDGSGFMEERGGHDNFSSYQLPHEILNRRHCSKQETKQDTKQEVDQQSPENVYKFWRRVDHISRNGIHSNNDNNQKNNIISVVDLLQNDYHHAELIEKTRILHHEEEYAHEQDICFQIKGILSSSERYWVLDNFVHNNGIKLNDISDEYPEEYRRCKRALVKCSKFANVMWDRMKPFLKKSDLKNIRPYGFDNNGTWIPVGLNDCFRVTEYKEGDYFKPHMDAQFVKNDNEKSILTVLIYLNYYGGGGETKFFKLLSKQGTQLTLRELACVQPHACDCLIFNHNLYHSGEKLTHGTKIILRTEIMFKRIDSESILRCNYENLEEYQMVKKLVDESEQLEKQGLVKEATEKYLQSQEMQVNYSNQRFLERENQKMSEIERLLPEEIFATILSYLTPAEICRIVLPLNSRIHGYARNQALWKSCYSIEWACHNHDEEQVSKYLNKATNVMVVNDQLPLSNVETSIMNAESKKRTNDFDTVDWYNCFITRKTLEREFCAILFDPGVLYSKYGKMNDSKFYVDRTVCCQPLNAHFNISGHGLNDIIVGHHSCYKYAHSQELPLVTADKGTQHTVVSCLIFQTIRQVFGNNSIRKHPLLIATPCYWTQDDERIITETLFSVGVPALCMISSYYLLALYYQTNHCLIVDVSPSGVYCVPIYNGQIVKDLSSGMMFPDSQFTSKYDPSAICADWGKDFIAVAKVLPVSEKENPTLWMDLASKEAPYSSSRLWHPVNGQERCRIGEDFYASVLHIVNMTLAKCQHDEPMKTIFLQNIIVRGGLSQVDGLVSRFELDMTKQYENKPKICLKMDPLDIIGGAKIFANLRSFKENCVFNV